VVVKKKRKKKKKELNLQAEALVSRHLFVSSYHSPPQKRRVIKVLTSLEVWVIYIFAKPNSLLEMIFLAFLTFIINVNAFFPAQTSFNHHRLARTSSVSVVVPVPTQFSIVLGMVADGDREEEAAEATDDATTEATTTDDGALYDDQIPARKETMSNNMMDKLRKEATTSFGVSNDPNVKSPPIILYISAVIGLLVIVGGKGTLY